MYTVTQYALWQAIWHSLAEANFYELDWTLRRNADLLATFVPWTFIGNHDTSRIASQLPDARRLPHALALLMTLPGTPAVYYGDEDGLRAIKALKADGVPSSDLVLGTSQARDGQVALGEHFPGGSGSPVRIVAGEEQLQAVSDVLLASPGIDGVSVTSADSPSGSARGSTFAPAPLAYSGITIQSIFVNDNYSQKCYAIARKN